MKQEAGQHVRWASVGLLETTGLGPALLAADVMEKAAEVEIFQAEINDFLGIVLKIRGGSAAVQSALSAGHRAAQQLGGGPVTRQLLRPDPRAWGVIRSQPEFNPLIQQDVVTNFDTPSWETFDLRESHQESVVNHSKEAALGFIETQGFTAVFQAIDTACKAANVEVIGKEKLGGGYVTVVIQGDVAAVEAAIAAGKETVKGLGTLIAAHVIARPSPSVVRLLPRSS